MFDQVTTYQLRTSLFDHTGSDWTLKDLLSDGSTRQYARFSGEKGESIVAMTLTDADEIQRLRNGTYAWLKVRDVLANSGFKTPEIIFIQPEIGTIFIEDLGDLSLEKALKNPAISHQNWLHRSVELAVDMACIDCRLLRPEHKSLSRDFLLKELEYFKLYFVEKFLSVDLSFQEEEDLSLEFQSLCSDIWTRNTRPYFCHRDFHSRNILVSDTKLAVIDFQDAQPGPLTYDLVSLCFDPYHGCLFDQRMAALEHGIRLIASRLGEQAELSAISSWRATAIQRILKALSSYAKFVCLEGKTHFRQSFLPALDILLALTDRSPSWPRISHLAVAARSKLIKQPSQPIAL